MGMPDHFAYLLRNRYAGQEATVITGHVTTNWFQIRKGYVKAVYCHPGYLTYMKSIFLFVFEKWGYINGKTDITDWNKRSGMS